MLKRWSLAFHHGNATEHNARMFSEFFFAKNGMTIIPQPFSSPEMAQTHAHFPVSKIGIHKEWMPIRTLYKKKKAGREIKKKAVQAVF